VQAAGAVWTPQKAAAAAGEGEGGSDDHITLVLDESVGQVGADGCGGRSIEQLDEEAARRVCAGMEWKTKRND